ncbi:hypothetical protein BsWGS_23394 [Bradybaena similaris]
MNAAAALLLIATTTVIKTECFRTFDKRQDADDAFARRCKQDTGMCFNSVKEQALFNMSTIDFAALPDMIYRLCFEYNTTRICIDPISAQCVDWAQDHVKFVYDQLDYICLGPGVTQLYQYQQSGCYRHLPDYGDIWNFCDFLIPGERPPVYNAT